MRYFVRDIGNACASRRLRGLLTRVLIVAALALCCVDASAQMATPRRHHSGGPARTVLPDSIPVGSSIEHAEGADVVVSSLSVGADGVAVEPIDTVPILTPGQMMEADSIAAARAMTDEWVPRDVEFSPNPSRAVWLSALFPGLGQVYNRRYWKLPIIVGGYMGLAYATSWNNSMLRDYNRAYADLMDKDPNTKSYMDLFAPNVSEDDIDPTWLENVLRSRKNYFRRNRDLCIICMVGVYLLSMLDAYVDAALSHFDISPDISMDVAPTLIQDGRNRWPSLGLTWAVNF